MNKRSPAVARVLLISFLRPACDFQLRKRSDSNSCRQVYMYKAADGDNFGTNNLINQVLQCKGDDHSVQLSPSSSTTTLTVSSSHHRKSSAVSSRPSCSVLWHKKGRTHHMAMKLNRL